MKKRSKCSPLALPRSARSCELAAARGGSSLSTAEDRPQTASDGKFDSADLIQALASGGYNER